MYESTHEHIGRRRGRRGPTNRHRWDGPEGAAGPEHRPGGDDHHDHGHHDHGHHGGQRRGGRGRGRGPGDRAQRGDVRAAILLLLREQPMHGYQIMQAIAERTGQAWRVSPGAVYPTLAALEDEGLVRTEVGGGRKLATLTAEGIALLADPNTAPVDPFGANDAPAPDMSLRDAFDGLAHAGRALGRAGTPAQLSAARAVLERARRELYLILAEDQRQSDGPVTGQ